VTSAVQAVTVGPVALAALHADALPQKDNLCGCFWGSLALRAAGVEADQDEVAVQSGTVLPKGDPATFVPPGEESRRDYRLELPIASDPAHGGTAAPSLAAAVESLSAGRLSVVPVAGPWSAESVVRLAREVAAASRDTLLIANVGTGLFWGTRSDPGALLGYLAGGEFEGSEPEWDVGHFVNAAAVVTAGERALVLVRDSYRGLGWAGHHLQPAEAFAAALRRDDGREGGVLCVAPASEAGALAERLAADGFELRHWDNGTPSVVTPTGS
jgi:hypothetical protein